MTDIDLHRIAVDAMQARGLLPAFLPAAQAQAAALPPTLPAHDGDVADWRALPWFSIDNDDTRDLDQLSVAEPLGDGAARLRVAVADVDVLVAPGSPIDGHAGTNTTSVYTAAGVFPMLPERLSTNLSSLHEGQDRLAVVVEMQVGPDGEVTGERLLRAVVHNHARLAYDPVAAWLEGEGAAPPALARLPVLAGQLRLHDRIAQALRASRQRRGALSLKTTEARPVFEQGRLVDMRPEEKNRAKELIADLMIAANSASARFLAARGYPSLRRFLQAPRRWDRLQRLAAEHGSTLPEDPDAPALERFLNARRVADPAGFADLSLAVVKMLGSGEYSVLAPQAPGEGHFGLAVSDYAHSTAPNRRFADLVTQRLLKAALAGEAPPYTVEALAQIARQCTLQEDNANKVERQVRKAAAALLLAGRLGEVFDALVTGASAKGTYVRTQRPMVEGRVVRGFEALDVGDAVRVRLVGVDAAQGHIDFERV